MSHHAYVLFGGASDTLPVLPLAVQSPSEDVSHMRGERMTIDEVRRLIRDAYLTPVHAPHRAFVLVYRTILPEAQHALLKLLEEPPHTALFFLIIEHEATLLPTLRSRLLLYTSTYIPAQNQTHHTSFETFRSQSPVSRLKEIAERVTREDTQWIEEIMNGFEHYGEQTKNGALLNEILMVRSYLPYPGASKKMLLEHLALSLPD